MLSGLHYSGQQSNDFYNDFTFFDTKKSEQAETISKTVQEERLVSIYKYLCSGSFTSRIKLFFFLLLQVRHVTYVSRV